MPPSIRRPPRIWIATLLSFFYPGAGQAYANDRKAAWVFVSILVSIWLTILVIRQFEPRPPLVLTFFILAAASIAVQIASAGQAFLTSRRARLAKRPKGNRVLAAVIAIGLNLIVQAIFVEAPLTGRSWHLYYTPSASMEPTLRVGNRFVAAEGRRNLQHLQRGDVVVNLDATGTAYVRRLIGFPGDLIEVREGMLIHNHTPLKAIPAGAFVTSGDVITKTLAETLGNRTFRTIQLSENGPGDTFAEVSVPQGRVFLMGDNRDNAMDSRFIGAVPIESIVGVVRTIYWSPDNGKSRLPRPLE